MKMNWKIERYCHKTWSSTFKQLALLPVPYLTYNPLGSFMAPGVSGNLYVISMNFLCWDFGIMIKQDID